MNVRSLGLSTDLQLLALRGQIVDRGDYLVVSTPDDRGYYFGNLLVLRAAPQVGEVAYWTRKFREEHTSDEIKHVTLVWDTISGDVGARTELEAAGFTVEVNDVMTAPTRDISRALTSVAIRTLVADEVLASADLSWANGDRHDDAYRQFLDRRALWKSELVRKGSARFYGAFDGETLVGSLGLVSLGDVARYQDVEVAASHRKRGIASALLATAAADATAETLVIVAESEGAAGRVYERAGFRVIERTASACRRPS
jgi:ribosomal protein S18 acetylase RimI-like enzyme